MDDDRQTLNSRLERTSANEENRSSAENENCSCNQDFETGGYSPELNEKDSDSKALLTSLQDSITPSKDDKFIEEIAVKEFREQMLKDEAIMNEKKEAADESRTLSNNMITHLHKDNTYQHKMVNEEEEEDAIEKYHVALERLYKVNKQKESFDEESEARLSKASEKKKETDMNLKSLKDGELIDFWKGLSEENLCF